MNPFDDPDPRSAWFVAIGAAVIFVALIALIKVL